MNFRDRGKERQNWGVSRELFSAEALAVPGTSRKNPYRFCLADAWSPILTTEPRLRIAETT